MSSPRSAFVMNFGITLSGRSLSLPYTFENRKMTGLTKVEDRVVARNGVLDGGVITNVTANLRTAQRRRVAVEMHIEEGDGMARLLEPLRQMAADESISTGDQDPIHRFHL